MFAVSAETMRQLDKLAAENGISTLTLMEKAGEAVSGKAIEILRSTSGSRVAVFCGKGNNGGDGFVAARKLIAAGFKVSVYLLGKGEEVKNEAAANLLLLRKTKNVEELALPENDVEKLKTSFNHSLIIDALTGTGFTGPVKGALKNLIIFLNSTGVPILSVDIPSGLNANTGKAEPVAIKAGWTISFGLPKKGFYIQDGPSCVGSLQVANIGFPEYLLKQALEFEKIHEKNNSTIEKK